METNRRKIPERILEWQRRLDPSSHAKKTAAHYKTAPAVILPGSPEIPETATPTSITISLFIDSDSWIAPLEKTTTGKNTLIIEKPPKTKNAKHGPLIILDDNRALAAVPTNENYWWALYELTKHDIIQMDFAPGKPNEHGKSKIRITATFEPKENTPQKPPEPS